MSEETYVRRSDLQPKANQKLYEVLDTRSSRANATTAPTSQPPPGVYQSTTQHLAHISSTSQGHEHQQPQQLVDGTLRSTNITCLDDLTHHYANPLLQQPCVIMKGIQGYCSFLNGIYRKVEAVVHHGRPVFRLDSPIPHGSPSSSTSSKPTQQNAFLYYKSSQKAWAIGMKIGSSGVVAYRKSTSSDPVSGSSVWMLTNPKGNFKAEPGITVRMAGGYTVVHKQEKDIVKEEKEYDPRIHPKSFSRAHVESILRDHFQRHNTEGAFIFRHSTSVEGAYILSVINREGLPVHLRVDATDKGYVLAGNEFIGGSSFDAIVQYLQQNTVRVLDGSVIPRLNHCILPTESSQFVLSKRHN
eukprot:m.122389 g.122389  ORF g.122389 m.122389 type:complete len:357 (+) comp9395_c0_seq3:130-1200(+)